jgi:hypothetical protein
MTEIEVEAYAGSSYPERPIRVRWRGQWRGVTAVESETREPDSRCFNILLEGLPSDPRDDTRLRVCYDYANDIWRACPLAGEA